MAGASTAPSPSSTDGAAAGFSTCVRREREQTEASGDGLIVVPCQDGETAVSAGSTAEAYQMFPSADLSSWSFRLADCCANVMYVVCCG
jgi:hypothetical protein